MSVADYVSDPDHIDKVEKLQEAGWHVTVVAPELHPSAVKDVRQDPPLFEAKHGKIVNLREAAHSIPVLWSLCAKAAKKYREAV